MKFSELPTYFRLPWPDLEIPAGEPSWLYYEIDKENDAVLRSIEVFPDGHITRNSIEIEERGGRRCPSLIDTSLDEGFGDGKPLAMGQDEFEDLWRQGIDTPFWNVRSP